MAQPTDEPPIAALFLIEFDVKAGYTVVWKQAVRGLDVSGAVEYKSLPSGLHEVAEDLVYFVHDSDGSGDGGGDDAYLSSGFAGLSAFINRPTDDAGARHARMLAVGVLVPRSHGRLGRVWRHAEALQGLARTLVADRSAVPALEAYWQRWQDNSSSGDPAPLSDRPLLQLVDSPLNSPVGPPSGHDHRRRRSSSIGSKANTTPTAVAARPSSHDLPQHHPAWGLTALLDTFGPLIFPIYRAALLRKRILISTQAPVREVNHIVYNISVLANIPFSALDLVEPAAAAEQRIRPLFTIGIHDMGFLLEDAAARRGAAAAATVAPGWIACTTDRILATKEDLWDVLVTMPSSSASSASAAAAAAPSATTGVVRWPTVVAAPGGVPVLATQRDLRRFRSLTAGLARLATRLGGGGGGGSGGRLLNQAQRADAAAEAVVEPATWAALAYNGFLWWASAGEQRRTDEMDESIHDQALLADLVSSASAPAPLPRPTSAGGLEASVPSLMAVGGAAPDNERAQMELAIITYFHRLTTQMLSVLADQIERSGVDGGEAYYDEEEDEEDEDENENSDAADNDNDADDDDDNEDDGLLGARRSGLSAEPSTLQLRRRGGRRGGGAATRRGPTVRTTDQHHRRHNRRHRRYRPSSSSSTTSSSSSSITTSPRPLSGDPIPVDSDALLRMGLDVWSAGDAAFVRGLAARYFDGRAVRVEGRGVEVCGLRLC